MTSFSFDDLLDGDEATGVPDKRTWYKIGAANDSLHSEPGNSLVDWTIKLGTNQYRVHRADLGDGSNGSGYFNSIFQRWTEGSTETDLTSSLQLECRHVFEQVLDFVYGGTVIFSPSTVVSLFKIAHYLQIPNLMKKCVGYMKKNLNKASAFPMLRKALVLSPGLDPIVHQCISTLALEFNSCKAILFISLPVETVSSILTKATTEFHAEPLKVSNVVAECVRSCILHPDLQKAMFYGLVGSLSEIAPKDALFMLAKAIEFEQDGVRELCLPTIASSFDKLNINDLAKIPDHKTVCEILDRDDLSVVSEDTVFEAIFNYCKADDVGLLSNQQHTEIWQTCRLVLLSSDCILRIMDVSNIPIELIKLALIGRTIRDEKGQEALEAFAKDSSFPSCRQLRARTGWRGYLKEGDMLDAQDHVEQKWYESKVMKRDGNVITVHFLGWGIQFDENFDISTEPERLMLLNTRVKFWRDFRKDQKLEMRHWENMAKKTGGFQWAIVRIVKVDTFSITVHFIGITEYDDTNYILTDSLRRRLQDQQRKLWCVRCDSEEICSMGTHLRSKKSKKRV